MCKWGVTKDGKRCKKKPGAKKSGRVSKYRMKGSSGKVHKISPSSVRHSPVKQYKSPSGGHSKEAMIRVIASETGRPKSYYADWSETELKQRLESLVEYDI